MEENTTSSNPTETPTAPESPQVAPVGTTPETTPPPAARIVVEAQRTERELTLAAELEAERTARRKAETDASYHADEARRLKELQSQVPAPKNKQKRVATGFWEVEED